MPRTLGKFTWYDLNTTDAAGAIEFYPKLTGWTTQKWEQATADTPYTMWVNGEHPVGGVTLLQEEAKKMGAPPHWLAYIETLDVDATTKQAIELGGTVLMPAMDLPMVGRFSIIQDPTGGVFSAFTPANESEEGIRDAKIGEFSWHELMTSDLEAGWTFYSTLFEWELIEDMDMGEMGNYRMYGKAGVTMGGIMNKPPMVPVSSWIYYLKLPNMREAIETITTRGGTIVNGPMEVPGGDQVAQAIDPQGAMFAIHCPGETTTTK